MQLSLVVEPTARRHKAKIRLGGAHPEELPQARPTHARESSDAPLVRTEARHRQSVSFMTRGPAVTPTDSRCISSGHRATRFHQLLEQGNSPDLIDSLLNEEDPLIEAIYQFNASPRRNIGVLCDYFKCEPTLANIAQLFHQTLGLLGDRIGEFLCHPDNVVYLKAYFQTINLRVDFLEAMGLGLSGPFFMLGEAQQVERTMQKLSEVCMEQNPGVFGHVNDPVVLGYALVMLNTDILKLNVTRKMTVDEFVANTISALQHSSIAKETLIQMYNSLKVTPFAFAAKSNDFMALCAPKLRGWLKKKVTRFMGGWRLRYYVLANSCVYYFKDQSPENKDTPL
jgi:Sec7-like guanine-nucleotide exchange factor